MSPGPFPAKQRVGRLKEVETAVDVRDCVGLTHIHWLSFVHLSPGSCRDACRRHGRDAMSQRRSRSQNGTLMPAIVSKSPRADAKRLMGAAQIAYASYLRSGSVSFSAHSARQTGHSYRSIRAIELREKRLGGTTGVPRASIRAAMASILCQKKAFILRISSARSRAHSPPQER